MVCSDLNTRTVQATYSVTKTVIRFTPYMDSALPHGSKMLSATLVVRTSNTVHMSKKEPFVATEVSFVKNTSKYCCCFQPKSSKTTLIINVAYNLVHK